MANVATLIPPNTARVDALKAAVQDLTIAHGKQSQDLTAGLYQTISAFGDEAGQTMAILDTASRAATAGVATTTQALDLVSALTKAYGDTSAAAVQQAADLGLTVVRLGQTDFPALGRLDRPGRAAGGAARGLAGRARGQLLGADRRHRPGGRGGPPG